MEKSREALKNLGLEDKVPDFLGFLEIYNERVHDLLVGEAPISYHSLPRRKGNTKKDLRVREHPSRGPYVQNLRRVLVHDVEDLLTVVCEGARRRRTAATRRNNTSSRSHALLELATPLATLHLADLAGSEKASWEGCGGGRQKEGANINKSLVALSNVISALVCGGSGRARFVPYRDSALTWLLKDCFTGSACTFIIATLSPSVACYGESASTLRWASRARLLPPPRNNNPAGLHCKATLQAKFNQLLSELTNHYINYATDTGLITYDEKHWTLQVNKQKVEQSAGAKANIGNIMNILRPKTEAHNSESTSSVASGSSDIINMEKNSEITVEINKEVDKILGPSLERTRSGSDLKIIAPLRHKRRQYRSQEVLSIDKVQPSNQTHRLSDAGQSLSEVHIDEIKSTDGIKVPSTVSILYDNQRAEIVASVTERLYSKLKKKEEVVQKVESMVDKKIVQPLNELKICTNARQRLVELSQRALKNKRRIGIPAHTQTKKSISRVKNQGIDIQTDLEPYLANKTRLYVFQRDASTETTPMTPRFKEVCVGPKYGSVNLRDRSTITDDKQFVPKNSFTMTDVLPKSDSCTQTPIVPPRRKRRSSIYSKYIKKIENSKNFEERIVSPVININISPVYETESETQSSDYNIGNCSTIKEDNITSNVAMTPDLLTNHSSMESKTTDNSDMANNPFIDKSKEVMTGDLNMRSADHVSPKLQNCNNDEFPDSEDYTLPRVTVNDTKKVGHKDIKDIILGRNENMYPYNIVLSPPRQRDESKRVIRFKDIDITPEECYRYKWDTKSNLSSEIDDKEVDKEHNVCQDFIETMCSDSSESSKLDSDSFVWRTDKSQLHSRSLESLKRNYTPVYKNKAKYRTAKAKFYKEFLGLDSNEYSIDGDKRDDFQNEFSQRKQYFENKFNGESSNDSSKFQNVEKKLIDSCNSLETSVHKYESYLANYKENKKYSFNNSEVRSRTPTEYLQHLVELRREAVKGNSNVF